MAVSFCAGALFGALVTWDILCIVEVLFCDRRNNGNNSGNGEDVHRGI